MTLLAGLARPILLILAISSAAHANPYVTKPGERSLTLRIATCAVSGGFVHLYTAIDNKLFSKYGLNFEHIYIQASAPSLAALAADEIQFLYCAADATLPTMASGSAGKSSRRHWSSSPTLWFLGKRSAGLKIFAGKPSASHGQATSPSVCPELSSGNSTFPSTK